MSNLDGIIAMGSEPIPGLKPEDIRKWRVEHHSERDLARAYADVSNKFWWVEDNEYDFESGTPEYQEACSLTDAWGNLMGELEAEIFDVLISEGVTVPQKGRIFVLRPFMERNGFFDGSGWWFPIINFK